MSKSPTKYTKVRRETLRAMKKCVVCGKRDENTLNGRWRCKACSDKLNKHQRDYYKRQKENKENEC